MIYVRLNWTLGTMTFNQSELNYCQKPFKTMCSNRNKVGRKVSMRYF